jgi:hypothetical protein
MRRRSHTLRWEWTTSTVLDIALEIEPPHVVHSNVNAEPEQKKVALIVTLG